ncbi:MAG: thioredoxin domain-containing protein [Hyphomonadaceae bacterium]
MLSRRAIVVGSVAGLFSASNAHATSLSSDEVTVGADNARIHLVEYASMTCPHCAHFHAEAWAALKAEYIDTGRVKYTLREMATPPAVVALGMFQVARCETTDPHEYFRRVAILFERQPQILSAGTIAGVQQTLVALGAEWQLSEAQIVACLTDAAGRERIIRSIEAADARGVTGTPAFFLNDARLDDPNIHSLAGLRQILDAAG